jgi:hypothetical protein
MLTYIEYHVFVFFYFFDLEVVNLIKVKKILPISEGTFFS